MFTNCISVPSCLLAPQVITTESGFGRIGGWLSDSKQAIWQVTARPVNDLMRDCGAAPDTLTVLASTWSGI